VREVERILKRLGHETVTLSFDHLECTYIENFDLLFLRGLPYEMDSVGLNALITCISQKPSINDPRSMLNARDKFTSIKILESLGIPVPATYLVRSKAELYYLVKKLGRGVLKPISGSLGLGVTEIDEFSLFYLNLPRSFQAIVQERVEKVRDVRVLVTKNRGIAAMYRVAPLDFVTNYWKLKEADPAPLEEYEELAVKAIKALGLEYGGVDLIETPEGPKVIEVNPSPLWEGLKRVTGKNVMEEVLKDLLGDENMSGTEG